jgi:hypothetical protein
VWPRWIVSQSVRRSGLQGADKIERRRMRASSVSAAPTSTVSEGQGASRIRARRSSGARGQGRDLRGDRAREEASRVALPLLHAVAAGSKGDGRRVRVQARSAATLRVLPTRISGLAARASRRLAGALAGRIAALDSRATTRPAARGLLYECSVGIDFHNALGAHRCALTATLVFDLRIGRGRVTAVFDSRVGHGRRRVTSTRPPGIDRVDGASACGRDKHQTREGFDTHKLSSVPPEVMGKD